METVLCMECTQMYNESESLSLGCHHKYHNILSHVTVMFDQYVDTNIKDTQTHSMNLQDSWLLLALHI